MNESFIFCSFVKWHTVQSHPGLTYKRNTSKLEDMNEPPDHDENDHSSSDSTTNRTNLVNQEDSLAENELDDDHCDLFSTQLEDEMFRDVQVSR